MTSSPGRAGVRPGPASLMGLALLALALLACTPVAPQILATQPSAPPSQTAVDPTIQPTPEPATLAPAPTHTINLPLVQSSTQPGATPTPSATASPTPTPTPAPSPLVFAVIGDYGTGNSDAGDVAALVAGWDPDLVITTGDNNYPVGADSTIDANIGQFYHPFIHPYQGAYGQGADRNRFFPTLGNHDWDTPGAAPYLAYFSLPGNERYYDFEWGPVHFFALDSDTREPDGVGLSSTQAAWLQAELAAATAPWKLVYMHHPPYSSGWHGSIAWMRWPFKAWGASAVLSGHDHTYERLEVDGLPYFVNGLGGGGRYIFGPPIAGSQVRFNSDYGAMRVEASADKITFQFFTRTGQEIDRLALDSLPP